MDSIVSAEERQRAFDRFSRIFHVHVASMQVFQLVAALPDAASFLSAQSQLKNVRSGKLQVDTSDYGATLVDYVLAERDRNFETIRGSALTALCGAFEYLLKASLVDNAASDLEAATTRLVKARVKVNAADVVTQPPMDIWFSIADRLLEQFADSHPLMHARSVHLFTDLMPLPGGDYQRAEIEKALTAKEVHAFNEAFLVRNCLVHNGGRVSASLSRQSQQQRGAEISLEAKSFARLFLAVKKFGESIARTPLEPI